MVNLCLSGPYPDPVCVDTGCPLLRCPDLRYGLPGAPWNVDHDASLTRAQPVRQPNRPLEEAGGLSSRRYGNGPARRLVPRPGRRDQDPLLRERGVDQPGQGPVSPPVPTPAPAPPPRAVVPRPSPAIAPPIPTPVATSGPATPRPVAPGPAPAASRRSVPKGWLFAIGAGLTVIIVIVASLSSSHSNSPTPNDSSDLGAAPAAASSGSPLAAWWPKVEPDFNAVEADLTAAGNDGTAGNAAALSSDCDKLTADIDTLQSDPPAPIAAVNTPMQAALSDFAKAGEECSTGISTGDTSLINQGDGDITAGDSELAQATGQIKAILGD